MWELLRNRWRLAIINDNLWRLNWVLQNFLLRYSLRLLDWNARRFLRSSRTFFVTVQIHLIVCFLTNAICSHLLSLISYEKVTNGIENLLLCWVLIDCFHLELCDILKKYFFGVVLKLLLHPLEWALRGKSFLILFSHFITHVSGDYLWWGLRIGSSRDLKLILSCWIWNRTSWRS